MKVSVICLVSLLLVLTAPAVSLRCVDNMGKSVDWFIALRMTGANSRRIYLVLSNVNKRFQFAREDELMNPLFSQVSLDKHKGAFWSDQAPGDGGHASSSFAHDKGMFVFDPASSTGFQMTHSVPLFPNVSGDKIDPISNVDSLYGQSFVCLSIKTKAVTQLRDIYKQLVDSKVFFYKDNTGFASSLSTGVQTGKDTLSERLQKALESLKLGEYTKAMKIALGTEKEDQTTNSQGKNRMLQDQQPLLFKYLDNPFIMISKHQKMKVPVFNKFLIPGLEMAFPGLPPNFGLAVETWSRPGIDSVCNHSPGNRIVVNVDRVQFGLVGQKNSQDHSKWAIGVKGGEGLVCIGGLNHMTSQELRGGTFVCIKDRDVWQEFKAIIIDDECGGIFN